MNYEMFDTMSKQHETMLATMQKFNKLAVTNMEKFATLQMGALRGYSDFGLQNLKKLSEVKNPSLMQDYLRGQGEALKVLGEKVVTDAKAVTQLGVDFNQESQEIARESFDAAARKNA